MKRLDPLHRLGAGLAGTAALLTVFSFYVDPAGKTREILLLLLILGGMSCFYILALWRILAQRTQAGLTAILIWSVIFRLLLFPGEPILETDFYRYLWDGFVLSHGFNPYQYSPQEILDNTPIPGLNSPQSQSLDRLRELDRKYENVHAVLSQVNNPTVVTIYPPFAQFLFGLSARFFPLSMYGWRLSVYLFDAVLLLTLTALLIRLHCDPRRVIVYAWSPLVLKEILNTLHFDGMASALLFLGILLAGSAYRFRPALAFACAALTKIYPLLIAPLWCKKIPKRAWLFFLFVIFAFTFLFSGAGGQSLRGWAVFADRWESNSSLVVLLEWVLKKFGVPGWGEGNAFFTLAGNAYHLDAFLIAKLVCAIVVLIASATKIIQLQRSSNTSELDILAGAMFITGAILLGSPVGNPWYFTWMVPFLCFHPRLSWLYLTLVCFVHYTFFIPQPWGYWPGAREAEYIPFFLLLFWEWRHGPLLKLSWIERSVSTHPLDP